MIDYYLQAFQFVETACIFLMFLISIAQISTECETQESYARYTKHLNLRWPRTYMCRYRVKQFYVFQDVLKTSWKTKNCYAEDVFKTSSRHVLKTSWRHYGDNQTSYWGYLYLTSLNVYLTNLYFTNLYLPILRRVQNELIRTQ